MPTFISNQGEIMHFNKEQASAFAEVALAFSQGKAIQYRYPSQDRAVWVDWLGSDLTIRHDIEFRIKPAPTYRPFSNAEEFKPHRDRWVVSKNRSESQLEPIAKVILYNDVGVMLYPGYESSRTCHPIDWDKAFHRLQFEDGSPFGVMFSEPA
jgi:hypothetical protein